MHTTFDALIIGGGYAGLSAALWLGRYRRSVGIISSGPVRNATSSVMHGYPGLDGQAPLELLQSIKTEAASYGAIFIDDWAERAFKEGDGFTVKTSDGSCHAKRLLVATGTADAQPVDIPDFEQFRGRTAWHCPACDGHEYTDKKIAIIGWHRYITGYAKEFLAYTASENITVYTHGHGDELDQGARQEAASASLRIVDEPIAELQGSGGQLESIAFKDGGHIPADAFFYNIAQTPRLQLLEQLGCKMTDGAVRVDNQQQTSVEGVYAAGDIVPSEDLVVVACSTGTVAAGSIHESLM